MSFLPSDAESSDGPGVFAPSAFQGYLEKKSPKGFFGKHLWQRRFFVLEAGNLSYHKDKQGWARGEKPIGVVRVDMIRDIQLPLESTHYGLRFDILAVGGHLFELMAPSEKSCTQWVRALRDEIGKRHSSVNELLRSVKDDQVAAGFWKSKQADDVKKLHSHAEAVGASGRESRRTSRANSRAVSRENSLSRGTFIEDDEEAADRAAALAVMMQEEANRKLAPSDSSATPAAAATLAAMSPRNTSRSSPPSAGNTPPQPPTPLEDEEKTAEEKASEFLKRQYTLGAVKAGGRNALRASIIGSSAVDLAEIEAQLPASERGAVRALHKRSSSSSVTDGVVEPGLSPPSNNGAVPIGESTSDPPTSTPVRRPIASYGDDDSDSDADTPLPPPRAVAMSSVASPVASAASPVSPASAASPTSASSPSPSNTGAIAATAAAADDSTPFISTILWKESPNGLIKFWQKRLFALQDGVVCYYKSKSLGLRKSNLAGTIPIHQITKVIMVSDQKAGKETDFNLLTSEGRVYKLRAESEDIAKQWIAFIQACDPKRLGCTYPGLVMRETKDEQLSNLADDGTKRPIRGRLVATTGGASNGTMKVAMSVLPSRDAKSTDVTIEVPSTSSSGRKIDEDEIIEEKTFWNFLRNKHSLLSIFYVKRKAAFPRIARWFLFLLDLIMNLFFVYVFIIQGELSPVEQVVVIVFILLAIEFVIAIFLRWFCYSRDIGPVESQVRLGICAAVLYGLFIALTAWKWTQLPESSAIIALVRFIASSIGVIFGEILLWFFIYSFAQTCCPCITLDDGTKSLDDIKAEEEERQRAERSEEHRRAVEAKRAKMKKKLAIKTGRRPEEEV